MNKFMFYFLHIVGILFTGTIAVWSFMQPNILIGFVFVFLTILPIISIYNYIKRGNEWKIYCWCFDNHRNNICDYNYSDDFYD